MKRFTTINYSHFGQIMIQLVHIIYFHLGQIWHTVLDGLFRFVDTALADDFLNKFSQIIQDHLLSPS